ncbi:MAG TPA: FG-GAP-like repeat-containing protein [Abditibacteriaceae bacterium]|jgi:hypothetical protein
MKNLMKSCYWLALCFSAYCASGGAVGAQAEFGAAVNYPAGVRPFDVAKGDFNNDGKLDLVSANDGSANISIRLGNGDGTFGVVSHFSVGGPAAAIAVGDFNEDNNLDIVTADESSRLHDPNNPNGLTIDRTTSLLLGNGDGTFAPAISFDGLPSAAGSTNPIDIAVADFNGDNNLDIATLTFGAPGWFNTTHLEIRPGNGNGTFANTIITDLSYDGEQNYYYDYQPGGLTIGDFNRDARPDVVLSCFYKFVGEGDSVHFLAGDGDGTFTRGSLFKVGTAPRGIASGDFNFDGKLDIATANNVHQTLYYGSNGLSVLSGNGDGTFNAAVNYDVGTRPWDVVVADFNGDGKSDLATSNGGSNNVSLFFGDGTGAFAPAGNYGVGANPAGISTGDFNGDGVLDLAAANRDSDNISVLLRPRLISINDVTVTEGNSGTQNLAFTVTLSKASAQAITVNYATANGTATQPGDYSSQTGTLSFAAGVTSKTILVPIVADYVVEADETFTVNLSNAVNVAIGDGQGIGTITNDDNDVTAPTVRFTTSATTPTGTTPVNGSTIYNAMPAITGTAADAGSGINKVLLRLYRLKAGTTNTYEYWNGTSWMTTVFYFTTVLNPTTGGANVSWSKNSGWPTGTDYSDGTYYMVATAYDKANRTAAVSTSFKKLTDNELPTVRFTTSATTPAGTTPVNGSTITGAIPTITGTATDAASGIAKVLLRLYRLKAGTTSTYEYWNGTSWMTTVFYFTTTLNPTTGGASVSWSKNSGWPTGTDFSDGTYYMVATAYDKANKTAAVSSSFKKATVAGMTAPTTQSSATLTGAEAWSSNGSVRLTFSGALEQATAENRANYNLSVEGQTVALTGAFYDKATRTVTLLLAEGTLQAGDSVNISWSLRDAAGAPVRGQAKLQAQ